ncbi:hypothetical protein PENTCL1PPCAC_24944, partial [Pristionchus entomophagus]
NTDELSHSIMYLLFVIGLMQLFRSLNSSSISIISFSSSPTRFFHIRFFSVMGCYVSSVDQHDLQCHRHSLVLLESLRVYRSAFSFFFECRTSFPSVHGSVCLTGLVKNSRG